MALMNLESFERTKQFKENRFSRMEQSLNFYTSHNGHLQSKLKNIQKSYESLKKEKELNEISSEKRIKLTRSILWEQKEDLKKNEFDKKAHIERLQGYILRQMKTISSLNENKKETEEKLSKQKRKAEDHSDEKPETKRKRYVSA